MGGFHGTKNRDLMDYEWDTPSGKRLHDYGKSPFWMGKLTNFIDISIKIHYTYMVPSDSLLHSCGIGHV